MSDLKRDSSAGKAFLCAQARDGVAKLQSLGGGRDLTLEAIRRGLLKYQCVVSHRQLQRLAKNEELPGAYSRQQGRGHWRVKVGNATGLWFTLLPVRQRLRRFAAKARPEFRRIENESGWSVQDAFDGYVARMELAYFRPEDASKLQTAMSKTFAQTPEKTLRECANEADSLRFAVVVRDLLAEGIKDTQLRSAVCQKLGISQRTFQRRSCYRVLLKGLSVDGDTHGKDWRARKLYKNQLLQETEHEAD